MAKKTIEVRYDKDQDVLICQVKIKAAALENLLARNESKLIDICVGDGKEFWAFGNATPWGGFANCWGIEGSRNSGFILNFPVHTEIPECDEGDYLSDLDVRLSAYVEIKKLILPAEIDCGEF